MYPFVASHACLSGDFGQQEVFGETWVLQQNKGALVYWGSSTYSYWDEDDALNVPCSIYSLPLQLPMLTSPP